MRTFHERAKPDKRKNHEAPSPQYGCFGKYKEKSTKTPFHPEELHQSKKKMRSKALGLQKGTQDGQFPHCSY